MSGDMRLSTVSVRNSTGSKWAQGWNYSYNLITYKTAYQNKNYLTPKPVVLGLRNPVWKR